MRFVKHRTRQHYFLYKQVNGGLWKEATLQSPVLVMALFKTLLVQPHLVEGGQFGKKGD